MRTLIGAHSQGHARRRRRRRRDGYSPQRRRSGIRAHLHYAGTRGGSCCSHPRMHARWLLGPLLLHTSPDGSLNLTVSLVGTTVTKGVALKIHHRAFVVYSRFLGDAETRSSLRARTDRYLRNVPLNAAMNGFSYVENKHGKTVGR